MGIRNYLKKKGLHKYISYVGKKTGLAKLANLINQRIESIGAFYKEYDVSEIINNQTDPNGYNRLDIFVRLLAIENEFGLNDYGWDLYSKMQNARVGNGIDIANERIDKFKTLISSWEQYGYDASSTILLDSSLHLVDGSHRLAMSIYYGNSKIRCKVLKKKKNIYYGKRWFLEKDYSLDEVRIIEKRAEVELSKNKTEIACLLWPPAKEYFEEILEKLEYVYKVKAYKDYEFSAETLPRFIKAVYSTDDIADWKIEKKLEHMNGPDKTVRYIILEFDNPKFRFKKQNGNLILVQGEEMKKMIRKCYAEKIESYFYDIICHTCDNGIQSKIVNKYLEYPFSIEQYLNNIDDLNWVILKNETDYLPTNFPKTFPFSKDMDILCDEASFEKLVEKTCDYFTKTCKDEYEIKKIIESESRCRIRIELQGFLVYQIDISYVIDGIKKDFCKIIIDNRVMVDGYWIPSIEDELCVRANEYIKYPRKERHLTYLMNHKDSIDGEKICLYVQGGDDLMCKI